MSDISDKALLPAGMQDGLPPEAAREADAAERLVSHFGQWGYGRVKPPLMEFEENLLHGPGLAMAEQT
ncbi:MAG: ATP phosphoribosyltransferase regulatory subunit, partial [Magnetovibrio sp.]|nr:ATP phosphoribosyltransferase regulatory subunit [Magnetovibrio sp.]